MKYADCVYDGSPPICHTTLDVSWSRPIGGLAMTLHARTLGTTVKPLTARRAVPITVDCQYPVCVTRGACFSRQIKHLTRQNIDRFKRKHPRKG